MKGNRFHLKAVYTLASHHWHEDGTITHGSLGIYSVIKANIANGINESNSTNLCKHVIMGPL